MKKSKSSHSQIFFEISSIKNFAIFTENTCFGVSLIKLQTFRPATFLKRDSNTGVSCGYCEPFESSFFYRKFPEAASDSPTIVQWSQLGCFLFDFAPSGAFEFELKITLKVAQKISFLLELFYQLYSISEYILEKH